MAIVLFSYNKWSVIDYINTLHCITTVHKEGEGGLGGLCMHVAV